MQLNLIRLYITQKPAFTYAMNDLIFGHNYVVKIISPTSINGDWIQFSFK